MRGVLLARGSARRPFVQIAESVRLGLHGAVVHIAGSASIVIAVVAQAAVLTVRLTRVV